MIPAPSILPHTHCPLSLSTVHTSYSTWSLCDHCTIHTATHSLSIVIVDCPHVLLHMVIVDHCTIHTATHSLSMGIVDHCPRALSLSTLSTHSHCTWSLCDHCTIHTATHSLSDAMVDTVHPLSLLMVIVDHCTIHTATHSLSNVIVDTVHPYSLHMVIV